MYYKNLFSSGKIGSLALKNRIIMAPMGTNFATSDGFVTEQMKHYYAERAKGGAGLIIAGDGAIDAPRGKNLGCQLCVSDDVYINGLRALTDCIHKEGTKIALQLVHAGKIATVDMVEGIPPAAPSEIRSSSRESMKDLTRDELARMKTRYSGSASALKTHALEIEEIHRLVQRFADAAERAVNAGFDGVEVHAGHGYLLNSFLSPAVNKRTDEYGGTLENRSRFLLEIIAAIRERVGREYPVWCRIDGREFGIKNGIEPEDSVRLAQLLEQAGSDAIHVSGYGGIIGGFIDGPLTYKKGNLVPYAANIKKTVTIPVIAVGRIDENLGESLLRDGKADFIAMGRSFLSDPLFPQKLASGNRNDIRPCIYCYRCVAQHLEDNDTLCTQNVAVGKEDEYRFSGAECSKRVLVVGGGPAGMEAARIAALRGHSVTLCERESRLGGSFFFASVVNTDNARYLKWLLHQMRSMNIDIRLNCVVDDEFLKTFSPDVVLVATGPKVTIPDIPGIHGKNVLTGVQMKSMINGNNGDNNLPLWMKAGMRITAPLLRRIQPAMLDNLSRYWMPVGHKVAILGADIGAVELAEFLVERGREVVVLTETTDIAPDMSIPSRWRVLRNLRAHKVAIETDLRFNEINTTGVMITTLTGEQQIIQADTVIIAGKPEPTDTFTRISFDAIPEIYRIGDCAEAALLPGAIQSATDIAVKL